MPTDTIMTITATIRNSASQNDITVATEDSVKKIFIPGKTTGRGSSVNGGELLFLALATCFCNDIYREASRRNMTIQSVDVTVSGNFGQEGEPASNIVYDVNILAPGHSQQDIDALICYVDTVAEIHNTLRKGVSVSLKA